METIRFGDRVSILGKNAKGKVAFIGKTHFSDGTWFGVVLDDAKGRHNGTVDGKRYFKCLRNHGVFVRACQIEKENADSEANKPHSSISNKPTYPNYLKVNTKQKADKYICASKSTTDMCQTKPLLKDESQQMKDNKMLDTNNKSLELKALKEKNEVLKDKLRTSEKSILEILEKYNKALEDIKYLEDDIERKKKQIKNQKLHLKLLKMIQCKHSQKLDSFGLSNKKTCENCQSFDESENAVNDDLSNSEDEVDLEDIKALTCMRHISTLEEQNKVMIEGLVELKNLLKSKCRPRLKNLNISQIKSDCQLKNKTGETSSFAEVSGSDMVINKAIAINEPTSQMKEQTKIPHELRKIGENRKGNGISVNEDEIEKVNSNIEPLCDGISMQEEIITSDSNNKSSTFPQNISNQLPSNESLMVISGSRNHPKALQNSLAAEKEEFQSETQTINSQHSPQLPKLKSRLKRMHFIRNKIPLNSDPVDELRYLMSKMAPNLTVESYHSDTSVIGRGYSVEESPESNSEKSKSFPELCRGIPSFIMEVSAKASGDHAMALPISKTSPKNILASSRVCQTQKTGSKT